MSHRRKPKKIQPEPATKPVAQRFATYKGDATHMALKGEVVGQDAIARERAHVSKLNQQFSAHPSGRILERLESARRRLANLTKEA